MSAATPRAINFKYVDDLESPGHYNNILNAKQIRARRRRALKRVDDINVELQQELGLKPIEEWDFEELAKGRPRSPDGTFRGAKPKFIDRELHEQIMDRFKLMVKHKLVGNGLQAMNALDYLLTEEDLDRKGRPLVPPTVRLQATQYVLDHLIGRPTQPVTCDVSVKLQGILGLAMVNPTEEGGYELAQRGFIQGALPGEIIVDEEEDDNNE